MYISKILRIEFDVPLNWLGVENKAFFREQLKIPFEQAETTAVILVKLENESVSKYISVTQDLETYASIDEYKEGLEGNVGALIEAGCKVVSRRSMTAPDGYPVDHMMVSAQGVLMSQYYVWFNTLLLCFATQVASQDDYDNINMENIVMSLQKHDAKLSRLTSTSNTSLKEF